MRWNLFVELIDKFDYLLIGLYEEEYSLDEIEVVCKAWLHCELILKLGASNSELNDCFETAKEFLFQRAKDTIGLIEQDSKVRCDLGRAKSTLGSIATILKDFSSNEDGYEVTLNRIDFWVSDYFGVALLDNGDITSSNE